MQSISFCDWRRRHSRLDNMMSNPKDVSNNLATKSGAFCESMLKMVKQKNQEHAQTLRLLAYLNRERQGEASGRHRSSIKQKYVCPHTHSAHNYLPREYESCRSISYNTHTKRSTVDDHCRYMALEKHTQALSLDNDTDDTVSPLISQAQ